MSEHAKKFDSKARPMPPMRGGRGMPVPKGTIKKGTLSRLLKTAFKYYKWQLIVAFTCILINSFSNLISSVFLQALIDDVIPKGVASGYQAVKGELLRLIAIMFGAYGVIIVAAFFYNRLMAIVSSS